MQNITAYSTLAVLALNCSFVWSIHSDIQKIKVQRQTDRMALCQIYKNTVPGIVHEDIIAACNRATGYDR